MRVIHPRLNGTSTSPDRGGSGTHMYYEPLTGELVSERWVPLLEADDLDDKDAVRWAVSHPQAGVYMQNELVAALLGRRSPEVMAALVPICYHAVMLWRADVETEKQYQTDIGEMGVPI